MLMRLPTRTPIKPIIAGVSFSPIPLLLGMFHRSDIVVSRIPDCSHLLDDHEPRETMPQVE
jgi:hypothetical protein